MGTKSVVDLMESTSEVHFSGFHMDGLERRKSGTDQPTTSATDVYKQPFVIGVAGGSASGSFDQVEDVGELTIDQGGHSGDQDMIQIDKFTSDVEESAIKLLAAKALTTLELKKKLLGKRFSPNAVEAVINKFQRRGYINDRLYAETFSQARWSSSSWGPWRIKQALFKKGVSQADAEKAVELVFKDNDCAEDNKSVIGLSKHSMDHLYAQASKQWFRGQNVPKETRKARIVRWLQYRGFDWNVINFILKKLDKQDQNSP